MTRGHHFTHCRYCNREYVCGDCITTECELGHNRKSCEHYQAYIRRERAQATEMARLFSGDDKRKVGMARLLADLAWDKVAESLSDSELAEEIKIKVWANQKIGTYEIALITQAIERLVKREPTERNLGNEPK